jgi:hypothetical protein
MPPLRKITFTGNGNAKKPTLVCLNMWNIYLPTGSGYLFPKKDITLVDTGIDIDLQVGMRIEVFSEGIIDGTSSCCATSYTKPGSSGNYRIVVPVINIDSSNDETGSAGALIATIVINENQGLVNYFDGTF